MHERGLICLSTVGGTVGDVRPLVALALALRARGFAILFVGNGSFERAAVRAGLDASEWFTINRIPQAFWLRTVASQRWLWGQRRRLRDRVIRRELRRHTQARTDAFWQRIEGPDNPRVVAAIGSISACAMLGRFGPQCAKIVSCPMPYQPSAQFTLEPPDLPRAERLRLRARHTWQHAWRRWRHAGEPDDGRQFREGLFHLVSASPAVFPRPSDWLPNMQVTGYTPLADDLSGWTPPVSLVDFLRQGPPPVYVGFGSYPFLFGPRGERLVRDIIEGCRRRQLRCVIQSPDVPLSFASDDVCILDGDVPHAWLFPRCAAIVHHGGYGTLHAALVARRPMIIYPFQTDQFLWAARMGELGVGPGFTARLRNLSAARLASDLATVTRRTCADHAGRLGASVQRDDGVRVQVAAIESIVEHTRGGGRPVEWQMPAVA
jgi:UDP:flavonoid glycosyltransferase YjiC (YdhE family)